MHLQIERRALLDAVTKAATAVERRNTIPIMAHLRIEADGSSVKITATNLDMEVTVTAQASVMRPGITTAPAEMLGAIVKRIPDGALVGIEEKNHEVTIKAGRSKFDMMALDARDFPIMATEAYTAQFDCAGHEFMRLLSRCRFAMSTEETRYYLNGVYLHNHGDMVRAVATDGHRLARIDSDISCDIPGVIVPRRAVDDLCKLFKGSDAVSVGISDTKIRAQGDGMTLVTKVIDGTFPDYSRVIPALGKDVMRVDAKALSDAVGRVLVANDKETRGVSLAVTEEAVTVSSRSGSSGAEDVVECEWTGAKPTGIGFNGEYLVGILSQIEGQASLQITWLGDPVVIVSDADPAALAILMPMRVG